MAVTITKRAPYRAPVDEKARANWQRYVCEECRGFLEHAKSCSQHPLRSVALAYPLQLRPSPPAGEGAGSRMARVHEMSLLQSVAGCPFTPDGELEELYQVWAHAGRPRNACVGYVMVGQERRVQLCLPT